MSGNPKAFIPAWLNLAGLSQAEFRVYCCLAARADIKTGIAWPNAETIGRDCLMARNTVWKALRSLEEKKLIRKNGKRFADSNRYQVLVPIGANEAPKGENPIGVNEIPIASSPIGANETPPIGANEILLSAQMDSREGVTNKRNQRKVTTSRKKPSSFEPSLEAIQFAQWFKSSLPESVNLGSNWQRSFAEIFDKLVRLDKRTPEQIQAVSRWARTDSFWKANFMSPSKLRDRNKGGIQYFDVFAEKMKQPSGQNPTNPTSTSNTGRRTAPTPTI